MKKPILGLSEIVNASLTGFGIVNQFIELTFSSEKYEEIKFFVDCKISSNDEEINLRKSFFDTIDKDVSPIVLFLKPNRKRIVSVLNEKENLIIEFEGGYSLIFHLSDGFQEPLNISFKQHIDGEVEVSFCFGPNGDIYS